MTTNTTTTGRVKTVTPESLTEFDLPRYVRFQIVDENDPQKSRTVHMNLAEVLFSEDMNVYRLISTTGGGHIVPASTEINVIVETAAEVAQRQAAAKRAAETDGIVQLHSIRGGLA